MELFVHLLLGVALLAGADDRDEGLEDPWMRITIVLEVDGTARTTFQVDDPALMPDTLRAIAETEDGAEGVAGGGLTLGLTQRPLDRIPELLAHLPADRSGVSVVVRVPPDLQGGDLWDFQAQLSAARIRSVRIVPYSHPALQPASEVP